ncbi:MAG: hypothetical protein ACR2OI_02530 [Acidimicrobiia bacterium]
MIHVSRSDARQELNHGDRTYTLVTRQWTIRFSTPWLGLGWSYRYPSAVEDGTTISPIRDYLMWMRGAAALLTIITTLTRRSRR